MISFVLLCLLLGLGHVLRGRIRLLQRLYLPSCVIGGLVGLALIQTILLTDPGDGPRHVLALRLAEWTAPWDALPALLINVVFACLFLGVRLPPLSSLWRRSGPQVVYGQIVAWGQYVVALAVWLLLITWLWTDLPAMFAGILPVGFEGGHGTAAGLGPVFAEHGWADGQDLALTSATFGIVSAIVVGMILVNWAARKGHVSRQRPLADPTEDDSIGVIPVDRRPSAGRLTVNSDVIETFSLHIVIVGLAVGIGMLLKQGLIAVQSLVPYLDEHNLLASFPLFPLCMIGGLIIQALDQKYDKARIIDLGIVRRIQNSALDFLVIAAIAMIRIQVVAAGLLPLLILVAAGIAWNVFCVVVLARRLLPDAWFERSIAEMGQSMGVTATGLLLLRVVDPDYETPAADAFATKQLIHEPIMGGGLWTSMAIPLLAIQGPVTVFTISATVIAIWFAVGLLMRRRASTAAESLS